jgi:hypothetical protein
MNTGMTKLGRVILDVPYSEKDEAKELGAWWDPDLKKWFVPQGKDSRPFSRWFPKQDALDAE